MYKPLVWGCQRLIRGEVPPRPECRIRQDTILTPFLYPNINAEEEDPEAR